MSNVVWRRLPGLEPADSELPPPGAVHLYSVPLLSTSPAFESFLSDDERARASRFHFDVHRRRFVVGRSSLRLILSSYIQVSPAQICFRCGTYGKPSLPDSVGAAIQFNLSHSEDLALVAVATGNQVGVDVECVRMLEDFDDLVQRFFARAEAVVFRELPTEAKPAAFFNLWTRKEAMLKATGEGIGHCLNQVEVSFLPQDEAKLLRLPRHFGVLNDWSLYNLQVQRGFAAAVAIQTRANL